MAIDRAQTGYNPAAELVRVTAAPNLQDVKVRDDVMSSGAFQLARQLGANTDGFISLIPHAVKADTERASAVANSMTTDELAAKVKSGEIHQTLSPVFNAAVNNIHYANIAANSQRNILSKIQTGELQFPNDDPAKPQVNPDGSPAPIRTGQQKLEEYLLGERQKLLADAGDNKFAVAGFDTHWNKFKQVAEQNNFETLAKKSIEFGVATAAESVQIATAGVQTPEQISQNFSKAWKTATLPSGALLTDDARKAVLNGTVIAIANSGNTANLNAILETKLDSGLTVRGALSGKDGGAHVQELINHAQNKETQLTHRAIVADMKAQSEQSHLAVSAQIRANVTAGTVPNIPSEMQVKNTDGSFGFVKTEPLVYHELDAQTKGMPMVGRLQTFSAAGVVDKEAQNQIQAGVTNINSLNFNEPGKPAGKPNAQFQQSFDTYTAAKAVDPAYANRLAGEQGAKMYDDIELLKQTMGMDLNGATMQVAQARNNPTYINGNDKITKLVDKVVTDLNPSWFGRLFGSDEITGNISNVRADVKRSAEVLIAAGASPETTMKSLETYVQKNVANVNGSLVYLRNVPQSSHASEIVGGSVTLIKRLVDQVGAEVALSNGFKQDEVQMSVSKDGGSYMFTARNQPLMVRGAPLVITKDQVKTWMETDWANYKQDKVLEPARKQLEYKILSTGYRSDPEADKYLTSETGFRKLNAAGLAKHTNSIDDLIPQRAWAREQLRRGATFADPSTPLKDYSAKP